MGLDTSHDAWHGAYSAFMRWRNTLAELAGYDVAVINWPSESHNYIPQAVVDWGHMPINAHEGEWGSMVPHGIDGRPEPLLYLIMHSDCSGHLEPDACAMLADRLEELLPKIPADQDLGGHIGNVRDKTRTFIDGCRWAAEARERLEFR